MKNEDVFLVEEHAVDSGDIGDIESPIENDIKLSEPVATIISSPPSQVDETQIGRLVEPTKEEKEEVGRLKESTEEEKEAVDT